MTPDKELAYQARIRELREALEGVYALHTGEHAPEDYEAARKSALDRADEALSRPLSRPDDLSALDAYVREEKRKVLREVAAIIRTDKCSGESGYAIAVNDATEKHANAIEKISEGLK